MEAPGFSVSVRVGRSLRRFTVLRVMPEMPETGVFSHIKLDVIHPRHGIKTIMLQDIVHTYTPTGQKVATNLLINDHIHLFYAEHSLL